MSVFVQGYTAAAAAASAVAAARTSSRSEGSNLFQRTFMNLRSDKDGRDELDTDIIDHTIGE